MLGFAIAFFAFAFGSALDLPPVGEAVRDRRGVLLAARTATLAQHRSATHARSTLWGHVDVALPGVRAPRDAAVSVWEPVVQLGRPRFRPDLGDLA